MNKTTSKPKEAGTGKHELNPLITAEESQLLRVLEHRITHQIVKWADLVQMAGGNELLGKQWTGGNYNDAEELAAAAVALACRVDEAMNTTLYAGMRTIAEFMQMPYNRLLDFYTQHYILTEHKPTAKCCGYVPYKTLKEWIKE